MEMSVGQSLMSSKLRVVSSKEKWRSSLLNCE